MDLNYKQLVRHHFLSTGRPWSRMREYVTSTLMNTKRWPVTAKKIVARHLLRNADERPFGLMNVENFLDTLWIEGFVTRDGDEYKAIRDLPQPDERDSNESEAAPVQARSPQEHSRC